MTRRTLLIGLAAVLPLGATGLLTLLTDAEVPVESGTTLTTQAGESLTTEAGDGAEEITTE